MQKLDHISHSQIDMWQNCPRQWEYRYVKGLKIPPSGALIIGRCYHRALEENFKQKIRSKVDLPLPDCLDAFDTEWNSSLMGEDVIEWEDEDPGESKDLGVALVSEYHEVLAPTVQPLRVEETITTKVADTQFILRMDMEDVGRKIFDHKTSARAYNQDDVDRDLQASATAFALGRPIVFYNHVAVKTKVPRIQVIRTIRTRADINWWLGMAVGILTQMRSGIAPPRPMGWRCSQRYCGYYELCRGDLARSYNV